MNTSKEAAKAKATPLINADLSEDVKLGDEAPLTEEETAAMNNLPALQDDANIDDIFAALENKETNFQELTADYIDLADFKMDEERAYICTGKTTFTTKDGEVKPAVTLIDRERKTWICASTVIVNSLFKVEAFPVGCKIKVSGKTKGKNGDYFNARVYVL